MYDIALFMEQSRLNLSLHNSLLYQLVHIPCNLLVGDLSIDLRAGNGRMPHHLSDALYRNTCLQSQRTEAMSSDMPSQRSTNATCQAHGFEMNE